MPTMSSAYVGSERWPAVRGGYGMDRGNPGIIKCVLKVYHLRMGGETSSGERETAGVEWP